MCVRSRGQQLVLLKFFYKFCYYYSMAVFYRISKKITRLVLALEDYKDLGDLKYVGTTIEHEVFFFYFYKIIRAHRHVISHLDYSAKCTLVKYSHINSFFFLV